jgi:hypothetical protein
MWSVYLLALAGTLLVLYGFWQGSCRLKRLQHRYQCPHHNDCSDEAVLLDLQELTAEVRRRQGAVLQPKTPLEAHMSAAERQKRLRAARSVLASRVDLNRCSHYSQSPGFFGGGEEQWAHVEGGGDPIGGWGRERAAAGGVCVNQGGYVREFTGDSGGHDYTASGGAQGVTVDGGLADQDYVVRQGEAGGVASSREAAFSSRVTEEVKRQRLYGPRSRI